MKSLFVIFLSLSALASDEICVGKTKFGEEEAKVTVTLSPKSVAKVLIEDSLNYSLNFEGNYQRKMGTVTVLARDPKWDAYLKVYLLKANKNERQAITNLIYDEKDYHVQHRLTCRKE